MITYHTLSERLYFSLSNDVNHYINHYIIIYDPLKMCLKNLFFHFYFLNTNISVTSHYEAWKC